MRCKGVESIGSLQWLRSLLQISLIETWQTMLTLTSLVVIFCFVVTAYVIEEMERDTMADIVD